MSLAPNLEPSILFLVPNLYWDLQDAAGLGILDQGVTPHAGVPGGNTTAAAAARDFLGVSRQFPGGTTANDNIEALWSPGGTTDQVYFMFFKFDALSGASNAAILTVGSWAANGFTVWRSTTGHLLVANQAANWDTGFLLNDLLWHSLHVGWVGGAWGLVLDGSYRSSGAAPLNNSPSQKLRLGGDQAFPGIGLDGRIAHFAAWNNSGPRYQDTNAILGVSQAQNIPTVGSVVAQSNQLLSAVNTVQTALNRMQPPIISNVGILSTHHLTGTGTLVLTGRGIEVTFDFVPIGWGFRAGLVNVFENRLCQLLFLNLLSDGATQVVTDQEEQYENTRVYLFNNNVPLTLGYDVTPGAGIVVRQLG